MLLLNLTAQAGPGTQVRTVLSSILRHPFRMIVLQWNFKAALLSACCRGALFLLAAGRHHHAATLEAVLIEAIYSAMAAGVLGALAQSLRSAQPTWQAEMLLFLVFPFSSQFLEFTVHALFGTAVFRAGLFASAALTGLSALFNLFAMRRGALLIGKEGRRFTDDLCSLPGLALAFVLAVPANLAQLLARLWRFSLAAPQDQE
jgi:hypothetical protein